MNIVWLRARCLRYFKPEIKHSSSHLERVLRLDTTRRKNYPALFSSLLLQRANMEVYEPSSNSLIQTVRDGASNLTWVTLLAMLVFSCVATRVITGFQSHQRASGSETRTARLAPYWLPWMGHGIQFLWNHVSFLESLRFVPVSLIKHQHLD